MLPGGDAAQKDPSSAAWRRLSRSFSVSAARGQVGNPTPTTSCTGVVFEVALGVAPPRLPARERTERFVDPAPRGSPLSLPNFASGHPALQSLQSPRRACREQRAPLHRSTPAARRFRPTLARSGKQRESFLGGNWSARNRLGKRDGASTFVVPEKVTDQFAPEPLEIFLPWIDTISKESLSPTID